MKHYPSRLLQVFILGLCVLPFNAQASAQSAFPEGEGPGVTILTPARTARNVSVRAVGDEVMRQRFVEIDFDAVSELDEFANNIDGVVDVEDLLILLGGWG